MQRFYMSISKDEIVKHIRDTLENCSYKQAKSFMDSLLSLFIDTIKQKGELKLVGYLKIKVMKRSARNGINPKTNEPIHIGEKYVVKIIPGSKLIEAAASITD